MNLDRLIYIIGYWLMYIYQKIIKLLDCFIPNIRSITFYDKHEYKTTEMNIFYFYFIYMLYKLKLYKYLYPYSKTDTKMYIVKIKYNNIYRKMIYESTIESICHLSLHCSYLFRSERLKKPIKSIHIKMKNNDETNITNITSFWNDFSDETHLLSLLTVFGLEADDIESINIKFSRKEKEIRHPDLNYTLFGDIFK